MSNTFGTLFRLTTFGESHGEAIGGVVDGMPAGISVDMAFIQHELDRRRPGQSSITTSRNESDRVELLSGVFEGKTTGAPIGFVVYNQNQHSADYDNMRDLFRPSCRLYILLQIWCSRPSRWRTLVGTNHHQPLCGWRIGKNCPATVRHQHPGLYVAGGSHCP